MKKKQPDFLTLSPILARNQVHFYLMSLEYYFRAYQRVFLCS